VGKNQWRIAPPGSDSVALIALDDLVHAVESIVSKLEVMGVPGN
jgi:hypothetical protein